MKVTDIYTPINKKKSRVAFYTLGCKLNFSETSSISRTFNSEKYIKVKFNQCADVYVINTCSVTENADKKFKKLVKSSLKTNPLAFIVAIGCYAQLQPKKISEIEGVDLVLGANEKYKIESLLNNINKNENTLIHSCEIDKLKDFSTGFSLSDRTRSFLKIQDGCDYKCSYCTIPLARGESRSDSVESIMLNVKKIASNGIKEIVLTGVNIGDFGKGDNYEKKYKKNFMDLLIELDELNEIERFRISSIEPNLLTNEIILFVCNSKLFAPHFHIPLQSGSDNILRKMKRRYLSKLYESRVKYIKSLNPNACIGVDVIVGFPGETNNEFLKTYNLLEKLDISYLHVFPYSERPNTDAISFDKVVTLDIRDKRSKVLRDLSERKRMIFYKSQIGKERIVLFENSNKKGYIYGLTENYIRVRAPWNPELSNKTIKTGIKSIDEKGYARIENYSFMPTGNRLL
ncbi:MAG: tRNA (N(6)-L-threonylcarbamoyladenosine(37)-C(2))-methylthiotransferase MtaB [Flavobacteriaceae bacterium]|nr:tRNA (N(6)-L-threonylcarbamoyladenosine(37)-C(2))-methylthiotransferase MtaB [Flavobacteriaceae bacterium]